MPPRRPLSAISGNKPRGPELTPHKRGEILGVASAGVSQRKITRTLGIPRMTVQSTLYLDNIRKEGHALS